MKAKRITARVCATLLGLLAAAGCGNDPVVGVLLALSGEADTYGESMKKGIELALSEAEADGSLPAGFRIVEADSATNPETAAKEYQRLVGDGARLVLAGVTSDEARALLPVINQTGIICLSPSASAPSLTKDSKFFYRVFTSDELEGTRAGRFLVEEQQKDSVLIYTGESEQARGIEPPFRHMFERTLGGKVVGKVVLTDANWEKASADLLAAHNPESVYIIAYADSTMTVLRHLAEKGYAGLKCITSASNSGEVFASDSELVEGIYFPQPSFDLLTERAVAVEFIKKYRAAFDQDPDIYAAHAFDAMRVIIRVFSEAMILQTSEIKKGLQFEIKEFPGVTGIIQFDDYGDVHHNPVMFIVKDGKPRNYKRWQDEQKRAIAVKIRNLLQGTPTPSTAD